MKLVSTPRVEYLRTLAAEILNLNGRGRVIVAVDGADAAARTAFADDLAAVLDEAGTPAFRASLRYFQRSREDAARFGADTPERHYRHGYDYSALRRVLLEPFRLGGSTGFVTQVFDPDRDVWIEPTWTTAPADAMLVIDGEFINRGELRDAWNYRILLESEATSEADYLYQKEERPRQVVSAVIDLSQRHLPQRVFSDSC
ncbi:hypothetical protein E3T61_10640 [Cryobacterium lactosi]|jgi:uridine kinase|uniref:Uridine kinase n=1 Tax=Cryobacterium lactosi TaxID=1259202 RepID=A0A4R9BRY2_9MICO|nr:hypothetical protein [Cryobacterium lactosi]TFD89379.1 hypothetical protein E3T61_10640 [Cryobacterium lactosi]